MSDTSKKSNNDRIKEAWDRWLFEDFTWEGLKNKPWKDDKSLQDYWRRHLESDGIRHDNTMMAHDELIIVEGQPTYHVAHLPLYYPDGSPTLKTTDRAAINARLNSLIYARLAKASQNDNTPALLQGTVFLSFDASPEKTNSNINAKFYNCIFLGKTKFNNTILKQSASFQQILFQEDVDFNYATFNSRTIFDETIFLKDSYFHHAKFNSASSFYNTLFGGMVNFEHTTFSDVANFDRTCFQSECSFIKVEFSSTAQFSNVVFSQEAHFNKVSFNNNAYFYFDTFHQITDFDQTSFKKEVIFQSSTFNKHANFVSAHFAGKTDFADIIFKGPVDFKSARFENITHFQIRDWHDDSVKHHQAFDKALFQSFADFSGSGFCAFAAFDEARFEKGIRLDRVANDSIAQTQFDKELARLKGDISCEIKLTQLEAGCRVLRLEMAKQGDKHREQLLSKFELITRRQQAGTPRSEKLALSIYAAISDYGSNLLRPTKIWLWMISVSGLIYAFYKAFFYTPLSVMTASSRDGRLAMIMDAYGYAFNRALPLSFWPDKSAYVDEKHAYSFWHFIFNCLSMGESVASAVLIFLFFLAMRRRFQIN